MKLQKFETSSTKRKKMVVLSCIGICFIIAAIVLYKTYAVYQEKVQFNIIQGKIGSFSKGDIDLAMTLNGQKINVMPPKSNAYYVDVACEGATGTWSNANWNITIGSFTNVKVSCTINFNLIYDAYIKNSSGVETKYEKTDASGLDRYVPAKGNYAVTTTCANSSWNKTTWSLDVTGTVTSGSKCKVVFEPMYTYYDYNPTTKTKTLINDIPTNKPYTKAVCMSGSNKIYGTKWNSTTKVVDFTSAAPNDTKCEVWFSDNKMDYEEEILKGADPVLADNLIPVTIADDGKAYKADITSEWYKYADRKWANAVILVSNPTKTYTDGQQISEDDIESYFVWIPKYSYKLWTVTTSTTAQKIDIKFGLTDTKDANSGECTTPGWNGTTYNGASVSGVKGNCVVGDYMTHPAFLAFNSSGTEEKKGMWVGKFETGYKGSTSTGGSQVNANDPSKVVIKPNINSWRSIQIGNSFLTSYNYKRELNSHMMKNTEWGAVAYLTNSIYGRCPGGSCSEITINSHSSYITGMTNTTGYFSGSVLASTTGDRSGIYDMSGGAWEQMAGNLNDSASSSGFSSFTTYRNYVDKYTGADGNARILGDATGEASGWYSDYATFVSSTYPWFYRGGFYAYGTGAGVFAFYISSGGVSDSRGFRVVLLY